MFSLFASESTYDCFLIIGTNGFFIQHKCMQFSVNNSSKKLKTVKNHKLHKVFQKGACMGSSHINGSSIQKCVNGMSSCDLLLRFVCLLPVGLLL